ncbi:MAG: 50S ribosomal protein L25 [Clostridium fessum]
MDVKAKRLRREGYVTGNVFGKKIQGSIPVKMEKKDVDRLLKTETKGGQIMLDVEGEVYDVLIKEVDYDAMANQVVEIDFQALVSNEKVHSVAEIIFENHDKVETGVLQEVLKEVSYRALPAALVEKVKVDVGEMEIGDTIRVKDLSIAKDKDVDILTDLEAVVATVTAVHNNVPETDEEADAEEAK